MLLKKLIERKVKMQCDKEIAEFEQNNDFQKTKDGRIIVWSIENPISLDNVIMAEPKQVYFDYYCKSLGKITSDEFIRLDSLGESREGDYGSYPAMRNDRIRKHAKYSIAFKHEYLMSHTNVHNEISHKAEFFRVNIVGVHKSPTHIQLAPRIERSRRYQKPNEFKTLDDAHNYINQIKENINDLEFRETYNKYEEQATEGIIW